MFSHLPEVIKRARREQIWISSEWWSDACSVASVFRLICKGREPFERDGSGSFAFFRQLIVIVSLLLRSTFGNRLSVSGLSAFIRRTNGTSLYLFYLARWLMNSRNIALSGQGDLNQPWLWKKIRCLTILWGEREKKNQRGRNQGRGMRKACFFPR